MATQEQKTVAFVLYPGLTLLDLVGPLQVFASLRRFSDQYRPVVVAERIEPMPTDGPLTVTADATFGDVPDPAVVIVPGGDAPTIKAMGDETIRDYRDSLLLFTSGRYDNLPGLPFPAAPDTYPGKDDVANYLQAHAAKFKLPVRLNMKVTQLTKGGGDGYLAKAGDEVLQARQVVVATGPFQVPFIPPIADTLDPGVHQIHSAHYRHPRNVPPGKVLVVGAANSGCQIAQELSATHQVELSVGKRLPAIPQRPLGRDIWTWATALRLDKVTVDSRLGKRLAGRDQVIGPGPRRLARRHGIRLRPRATNAAGHTVTFADGSTADFDAVVWATGFVVDHSWIDIPEAKDDRGHILHQRGVTPVPGLYMLGLTWQHTRGSALLGWVENDAAFLAEQIASR